MLANKRNIILIKPLFINGFIDAWFVKSVFIKGCALLFCILSLQGCQDQEMLDLKEFVATAYQDRKPEIDPLPEMQPYKGFEYSAKEPQDPFSFDNIIASKAGAAVSGLNPDTNRRREPLEQYPLDALKLVGTMIKNEIPWIVVQTSEGIVHRATVGNYMGQHEGKIKAIFPDQQKIILTELVADPNGRWINRDVEIIVD